MEDNEIIELYFERNEQAIAETAAKYGSLLSRIAVNILRNKEDGEECVNDTYLKAWNTIPPNKPDSMSCYLGRITRNLALNVLESKNALKRGKGRAGAALEELEECIPSEESVQEMAEEKALIETINRFLEALPKKSRVIFVKKYWYMESVKEIAAELKIGESSVKITLMRTRKKLREYLESEGIEI